MMSPLPPETRKALAHWAEQYGAVAASRQFGTSLRTTRRWCNRKAEKGSFQAPTDPLSPTVQQTLLKLAPTSFRDSLQQIKEQAQLDCSLSTISRFYKKHNIPVQEIRLGYYRIKKLRRQRRVINLFYYQPRSFRWPDGLGVLVRTVVVPFFRARNTDYFCYDGTLFPVTHPLYSTVIQPQLRSRGRGPIWLGKNQGGHYWHILDQYGDKTVIFFCGTRGALAQGVKLLPPLEPPDAPVCHRCLNHMITRLHTRQSLAPVRVTPRESFSLLGG